MIYIYIFTANVDEMLDCKEMVLQRLKNKITMAGESEVGTFQWTDEHQKAFNILKAHLTSVLVLGYPDFSYLSDGLASLHCLILILSTEQVSQIKQPTP